MLNFDRLKRPKVVVVGSYNADMTVACSELPAPGKSYLGGALQILGGGRGANCAVAAARAGCEVTFVGAHGRDGFGGMAQGQLAQEGIHLQYFLELPNGTTGTSLNMVEPSTGRNLIVVAQSANDMITPQMVRAAWNAIKTADLVISELEISPATVWATMNLCAEYNTPFILDAAPSRRITSVPDNRILAIVTELSEALAITQTSAPMDAIGRLHQTGCRNVVLVRGNEQVIVSDGNSVSSVRVPVSKVVDRCGGIECLDVWLGLGLIQDNPIHAVAETAVLAMAYSLSHAGGQRGMPRLSDLLASTDSFMEGDLIRSGARYL